MASVQPRVDLAIFQSISAVVVSESNRIEGSLILLRERSVVLELGLSFDGTMERPRERGNVDKGNYDARANVPREKSIAELVMFCIQPARQVY